EIVLELELPLRTAAQQIRRSRVADAIREDEVQPISHFIDEVVHVAVEAAVVIAGEEQAPLAVEEYPTCEVDGADTRQPTALIEQVYAELEHPEDGDQRAAAKAARLDAAEGAELVGDVVVLEDSERSDVLRRRPRRDHRVGAFAPPQLAQKKRRYERRQQQQ